MRVCEGEVRNERFYLNYAKRICEMKKFCTFLLVGAVIALLSVASFGADLELKGKGATFPLPLYTKMLDEYNRQFEINVEYEGIGSSGGIKALSNREVDFGGTDAFMSDDLIAATGADIVHIPTCLGAVAVTYHLSGNPPLNLSQEILADIFLGEITKWNDKEIAALNPDATLPNTSITIVHRSDGSGTTNIFTDFLTKISPDWAEKVGKGKTVEWPVGVGVTKNSGVAGMIKQLPGAIGYVEMSYAIENNMPVAAIENKSGKFVSPSLKSTSLSAEGDIPADTRVSLTDTSAESGYPITGFTWIILYQEQSYDGRTREQAQALVDLVWWMTHEGQVYPEGLNYAPLPERAVGMVEAIIGSITFEGKPIR
jgi:phosphate transport system substrate-binding protein